MTMIKKFFLVEFDNEMPYWISEETLKKSLEMTMINARFDVTELFESKEGITISISNKKTNICMSEGNK